jgi:hypothetical protein
MICTWFGIEFLFKGFESVKQHIAANELKAFGCPDASTDKVICL